MARYICVVREAFFSKLRLMYPNEKVAFMQNSMTICRGMCGIPVNILNKK
jgi:hypothetical protein